MASSLLDRAIYSYADVDRLVGLHAGTARRWLEGYQRLGRFYDPVLRPEPSSPDVRTPYGRIEIVSSNGRRVIVDVDVDPEKLLRLIRGLEALP